MLYGRFEMPRSRSWDSFRVYTPLSGKAQSSLSTLRYPASAPMMTFAIGNMIELTQKKAEHS
jgi:hypothetical protein